MKHKGKGEVYKRQYKGLWEYKKKKNNWKNKNQKLQKSEMELTGLTAMSDCWIFISGFLIAVFKLLLV